jgi:hypothetical protein
VAAVVIALKGFTTAAPAVSQGGVEFTLIRQRSTRPNQDCQFRASALGNADAAPNGGILLSFSQTESQIWDKANGTMHLIRRIGDECKAATDG